MNDLSDQQLLHDYGEQRREAAFAELVRRHVDLVYSAALRMVCDAHLAEDVTQGVFVALARNAPQLGRHPVLTGWLHCTARNLAAKAVRSDVRRRAREQEAAAMNELLATPSEASWKQIAPHLDAALGELNDDDRDAVLLRYFEKKSAQEMAAVLGVSAEAAQKRVNRAVERLRESFARRGVTVGAGGLAVVIAASAVQAASVGLAVAISAAALAGTAVSTSTVIAATKTIAMTALQKTIIGATLAAAVGTGIYEAHQAAQLREQNQTLQQQQAPLAGQIQQLQRERDAATNQLVALAGEVAKIRSNNLELLKLRNEIAMLRRSQAAPQMPANSSASTTGTASSNAPLTNDVGRELGMAVVRGDAGAFDKLLAESAAEHQTFNASQVGLDDTKRGELSSRTFTPINTAFRVIEEAATKGSQPALDALARALQSRDLRGLAVSSLGGLAADGDEGSLDVLLHPEKYGVLLSSTIAALQPAADAGNPKVIDALAAVANDQNKQALWYMTAESLAKAAAAGNAVAIDALIAMSSATNRIVQGAVAEGLRGAAANQNAKAAAALRSMGFQ